MDENLTFALKTVYLCRQVIFILTVDRCEFGFVAQKPALFFFYQKVFNIIMFTYQNSIRKQKCIKNIIE